MTARAWRGCTRTAASIVYSRWEDAMIAQTRLLHYSLSPLGRDYIEQMQGSLNAQHEPVDRQPPGFLNAVQFQTLSNADPIYVSDEVTEIIDVARDSFKPEPIRHNDPFTQFGFMLFPRAICLPDSDEYGEDAVLPVRAMSWMPVISEDDSERGCFWISYYTHTDDDVRFGSAGNTISQEQGDLLRSIAPLSLSHIFQWTFNDAPWERGDYTAATGSVESANARGLAQVTLAQVAWRIGQQFVRGAQQAPRQIWKDAKRKGIDKRAITIITLRRTSEGHQYETEGSGRELTVRHIVRGHWHTYHTKDGPRQLWIAPFIRGADHLPFKATERVFEFVR